MSFSKENWKLFENLAIDMIAEQYRSIPNIRIIATSYIKDGGFDGSLCLPLTKEDSIYQHSILALLEAKLRERAVNIHDFAATVIVAHNLAAHIIYVVTNNRFSDATIDQFATYSYKTNVKVILVNGESVLSWLENKKLDPTHFPQKFVKELKSSIIKHMSIKTKKENKTRALPTTPVILDNLPVSKTYLKTPTELYGEKQNALCDRILYEFELNAGSLASIVGVSGSGKTTLIDNVGYRLEQSGKSFQKINFALPQNSSVKQILLMILKALWSIDIHYAFSKAFLDEYVETICSFAGGQPVASATKDTIKELFLYETPNFDDLSMGYIVSFLDQLLSPKQLHNQTIIALSGLNMLPSDSLQFVEILISCLHSHGIGLLLELRSMNVANISPEDITWKKHYDSFMNLSKEGSIYEVPIFDQKYAIGYVREQLPGLSYQQSEFIVQHVGVLPLFLHQTCKWLIAQKIVISSDNGTYQTVINFERFFHSITPDSNLEIIANLLQYYRSAPVFRYQQELLNTFEAIALLDGNLNRETLQLICPEEAIQSFGDFLEATGLFEASYDGFSTQHELILYCLRKKGQLFRRKTIAGILLENLDLILPDFNFRQIKKLDLLEVMEEWSELCPEALALADKYIKSGKPKIAGSFFMKADNAYRHIDYKEQKPDHIEILYGLLYCQVGDTPMQLDEYKTELAFISSTYTDSRYIEYKAMTDCFEALYYFKTQRTHITYEFVENMLHFALAHQSQLRTFAWEQICISYVFVSKQYLGIEHVIQFLGEQKSNSLLLEIQYYSHMAAKHMHSSPKIAIGWYDKIISKQGSGEYYMQNIGHAFVDKTICQFLLHGEDAFTVIFSDSLKYIKTNSLKSELGRLHNVLGLYYWEKNMLDKAEEAFRNSEFYLGQMQSYRLLTATKTNLVNLLLARNQYVQAKTESIVLEKLYLENELNEYFRIIKEGEFNTRSYAELLSLCRAYIILHMNVELDRLQEKLPSNVLSSHIERIRSGARWEDIFLKSNIIHDDKLMITY